MDSFRTPNTQKRPVPRQSVCVTMKVAAILTVLSVFTCFGAKPPNIVLLFADDISPRELPVYGSTVWTKPKGGDTSDPRYRAQTPVLDRLAKDGCYIETVWAATVCMPSRAMLMTGRYATQTKWWHNRDFGKVETASGPRTWYLFESSPIGMGQVAAMGGYASVWAGKTQMQCYGEDFQKFGFDEGILLTGSEAGPGEPKNTFKTTVKKIDGQNTVWNFDTEKPAPGYPLARRTNAWRPLAALMNEKGLKRGYEWWPNTPERKAEYGLNVYGPDIETDYCLDFMERHNEADKPFLVYHATHLGHGAFDWFFPDSGNKWPGTPIINWDGEKYTRVDPNITGSAGTYDTHGTVTEPGLHAHIHYCDYMMWRYVEKAKELGIYDNTIFIFAADNGSHVFGKGRIDQQRGSHVPLIIHAPGMTKQGNQKIISSLTDILPTLADMMGVEFPDDYALDGKSLWPYLTTNKVKHHDWIYSYKSAKQMIRGHKVLRDGYGKWWDVAVLPDDHESFPEITDWGAVSEQHREEREKLLNILPTLDVYETEYNAPSLSEGT